MMLLSAPRNVRTTIAYKQLSCNDRAKDQDVFKKFMI